MPCPDCGEPMTRHSYRCWKADHSETVCYRRVCSQGCGEWQEPSLTQAQKILLLAVIRQRLSGFASIADLIADRWIDHPQLQMIRLLQTEEKALARQLHDFAVTFDISLDMVIYMQLEGNL